MDPQRPFPASPCVVNSPWLWIWTLIILTGPDTSLKCCWHRSRWLGGDSALCAAQAGFHPSPLSPSPYPHCIASYPGALMKACTVGLWGYFRWFLPSWLSCCCCGDVHQQEQGEAVPPGSRKACGRTGGWLVTLHLT